MFRQFFRIGFGGCGCDLEDHFRKHAVEQSRESLRFYLKELERWKLSDEKFGMDRIKKLPSYISDENEGVKESVETFKDFEKTLNEILRKLENWNTSLGIARDIGVSYDKAIIDDLRRIITKMEVDADRIIKRGKVLLESLPVDSAPTSEKKAERFHVYNQNITETRELIVDHFGHAVIESAGFNHHPELQMLPLSIKEVRDEVYKELMKCITAGNLRRATSWGYFFFVGLGGGTGTGVISPLAEKFGKGSYGYFTLALLGGKDDKGRVGSQQPWFRRCFNMLLALNDLIVTAELDGIILVDNDVIIKAIDDKKEGEKLQQKQLREEIDKKIIEALYPAFGLTTLESGGMGLDWSQLKDHIGLSKLEKRPPVIVPCYASSSDLTLPALIDEAIESGKLAPCEHKHIKCLFCWDNVPGDDEGKLTGYLKDDFGIDWVSNAKITKFPDGTGINISNNENSAEITMVGNKEEAILKINDDKNDKEKNLKVKKEGGKTNIYKYESIVEKVFVYARCIENEDELRDKLKEEFGGEVAIIKNYLFCWDDVDAKNEDNLELKKLKKFLNDICKIEGMSKSNNEWACVEVREAPNNNGGDSNRIINKLKELVSSREDSGASDEEPNNDNKDNNKPLDKLIFTKNSQKIEIEMKKYIFDWDDETFNGIKNYLKEKKIVENEERENEKDVPKRLKDRKTIKIGKAEITLDEEKKKATLSWDKNNKRHKLDLILKKEDHQRKIYELEPTIRFEKINNLKPGLSVKKVNGKRHVYLEGCDAAKNWVLESLEKKIIVLESDEIGTFWKEHDLIEKRKAEGIGSKRDIKVNNEVLILLVNPDVKNALYERLNVARNFVWLLDKFKTSIDEKAELNGTLDKIEIANTLVSEKGEYQRYLCRMNLKNGEELNNLNNGGISENLKNEIKISIKKEGFLLSDSFDVKKTNENEWEIINGDNTAVDKEKKENEKFIITMYLRIDKDKFEGDLNKCIISEKLKDVFKTNEFPLSENAMVTKEKDDNWVITDEKEIYNVKNVKKEDGKLNIYRKKDEELNLYYLYYPILDNLRRVRDIKKDEDPLVQARDFLFPKELYKNKAIYDDMGMILDRLNGEVLRIGRSEEWWPLFVDKIFDIISLSGKHDEVLLSVISALEGKTKERFGKLVGEGVYDKYFKTYQRQFFKYNNRYLYHRDVTEAILSDEAEEKLPKKLKAKICEQNGVEGLEKWVEDYMDEPVKLFSMENKSSKDWKEEFKAEYKTIFENNNITLNNNPDMIEGKYLFNWEEVPGDDNEKLKFLKDDHNIEWAKDAKIDRQAEGERIIRPIKIDGNGSTQSRKIVKVNKKGYTYEENDAHLTIIDGETLYFIKKDEKIDVSGPSDLSFPAMLAVAGLYAEWEQVGSLPYDKNENRYKVEETEKNAISQKLFGKDLINGKFEIYVLPKESKGYIGSPNIPNILIIDTDKEDATLVIRKADKVLPQELTEEVVSSSSSSISPKLEALFKGKGIEDVNNDNYELKDGKLQPQDKAIKQKKLYRCYYIRKNDGNYSIDGDKIHNTLKVKKEEGEDSKKLKIYKKRRDKFEAARVDGASKN
jgi:hypothetical protein